MTNTAEPKKSVGNPERKNVGRKDASMSQSDRRRARMEEEAVKIMEKVMRRRHWSALDKDHLADFLDRLVTREIKNARLSTAAEAVSSAHGPKPTV